MTASPQHPAAFPQPDFPDWLHPMLVKSLRQNLRGHVFVGVFLWTQLSLAFLVVLQAVAKSESSAHIFYLWRWIDIFLILVVMVPLWPVFVADEDRQPSSLDVIRLTPISPTKLVEGKLLCVMAQAALLTVTMVPYGLLSHYLGRIEVVTEMEALLWVFANMFVFAPWGILLGSLPVGARVALAPVLLGGLLFVVGGLVAILLFHAKGVWCPWIALASVVWVVGYALAGARYEMR
jgi:hypothetical protein